MQWKQLLVKRLCLKIPLQAPNGPCRTLLLGEMGKTFEIKSMTHSNLKMRNWYRVFGMTKLRFLLFAICCVPVLLFSLADIAWEQEHIRGGHHRYSPLHFVLHNITGNKWYHMPGKRYYKSTNQFKHCGAPNNSGGAAQPLNRPSEKTGRENT